MLNGTIDAKGHPRVGLTLRGPFGFSMPDAIVDTGFTGTLSLPVEMAQRLGLQPESWKTMLSANGNVDVVETYDLEVEWLDGPIRVRASGSRLGEVIVGATLLRGHFLTIDYGASRSVEIR